MTKKAVECYNSCRSSYEKLPVGANGLGKYDNRLTMMDIGTNSSDFGEMFNENT